MIAALIYNLSGFDTVMHKEPVRNEVIPSVIAVRTALGERENRL